MSRVGKMPITVPQGVDVQISAEQITVKGANGTLVRTASSLVNIKKDGAVISLEPANESVAANAMSGTMRALINNMVNGVSKGFEKKLTLVGVGFRAQAQGPKLNLQIGFSHPVTKDMPCWRDRGLRDPDRNPDQGRRPASGWPGGCRSARHPPARALQGQGDPLRR
jgi:large subunit ribosomal protein L6